MLDLKKYQEDVLNDLTSYLDKLIEAKAKQDEYNEFLKQKNKPPEDINFPGTAWKAIGKLNHIDRIDGTGKFIPNICLKVPTGGGKTLLATYAARKINQHYLKRNTGLILWVMPSDAIYSQTLSSFRDTDHPYRQVLDLAAPRKRIKVIERQSYFSKQDVLHDLSVMLLMTQASSRKNKETLRMFRDSGSYMDFFPSSNDYGKHAKLLEQFPNLDFHEGTRQNRVVKCSLGNVLKILRPIIILDEGHTATSITRRETFNHFNPSFILELSATPPSKYSNLLVNVPGQQLKEEEMIKLPIQIKNNSNADWKHVLSDSCERLKDLTQQAEEYRSNGGKYIRPMLIVRAESTGTMQRGKGTIHSEDVREYFTEKLGFRKDQVKVKTSTSDEIKNINLLSPTCPIKVIITKDALKEGWDCPFAYVLALLDKTRSTQSLTQMIGRVLRQPHAKITGIGDLDTAHVFCFDDDVSKTVQQIKKALDNHGLVDREGGVINDGVIGGENDQLVKETILRRESFKELDIPMPQVLHKDNKSTRLLDYDRDILANINWGKFKSDGQGMLLDKEQRITEGLIDINHDPELETNRQAMEGEATDAFFARNLSDVIPNPWQAMRIIKDIRPIINKRGTAKDIYNDRMNIVVQLNAEMAKQKEDNSYSIFSKKLKNKEIVFKLDATKSQWKIPTEISTTYIGSPTYLTRKTNEPIQKSLFEKYHERDLNEFEKKVAGYLDEAKAIKWWHRVAARQEYGLRGWRKHIIYPDFVAFIAKDKSQSLILETKGKHLLGNDDTNYKNRLFSMLEDSYFNIGEANIDGVGETVLLKIISDENEVAWKQYFAKVFSNTT